MQVDVIRLIKYDIVVHFSICRNVARNNSCQFTAGLAVYNVNTSNHKIKSNLVSIIGNKIAPRRTRGNYIIFLMHSSYSLNVVFILDLKIPVSQHNFLLYISN